MAETFEANLLRDRFTEADGIDQQTATQLWHVTFTGMLDPSNASEKLAGTVPINLGDHHVALTAAVCIGKTLLEFWPTDVASQWGAYVLVQFDSRRAFGAANVLYTGRYGRILPNFSLPVFTETVHAASNADTGESSPACFKREDRPYPRMEGVYVRQVRVASAGDVATAGEWMLANAGKRYAFFGIPFILDSRSKASTSSTGQGVIEYVFTTRAEVRAFAIDDLDGLSIALPKLEHLDEYSVKLSADGSKPVITAQNAHSLYDVGQGLPFT